MRRVVTILMIVVGLTLTVVSYFFWATPWCATSVSCSNPRVPWTAALVVVGILLAFSSAVFYSVYKDRE